MKLKKPSKQMQLIRLAGMSKTSQIRAFYTDSIRASVDVASAINEATIVDGPPESMGVPMTDEQRTEWLERTSALLEAANLLSILACRHGVPVQVKS
jgi:hypothetical protein